MTTLTVKQHYASIPYSCAICGSQYKLVRDHDHCTGRCRGWLCNRCNIVLGILENCSPSKDKHIELRVVREVVTRLLAYVSYWGDGENFRSRNTPQFPAKRIKREMIVVPPGDEERRIGKRYMIGDIVVDGLEVH